MTGFVEGFMLQVTGEKSVQGLRRVDALKGFQAAVAQNKESSVYQIAEFPEY